jgi:predicted dehydrogenase
VTKLSVAPKWDRITTGFRLGEISSGVGQLAQANVEGDSRSSMPSKIKCGVIGAGWWATYAHIPALLAHPQAELVAIQKRRIDEAQKVAADFGVPHACTTVDELLQVKDLAAVVVSSSPNLHHVHALAALKAGKHVLIEKPMTITVAEAEELVFLARQSGLQLLISCPWHYTSHATAAGQLLQSGKIGQVRMISALMTNPVSHLIRGGGTRPTHGTPYMHPHSTTYSDPRIAGGGQIYTQVSHLAAYLTFLTGQWPRSVFARFHNDGSQVDIYDTLNVSMSDQSIVSIASTGATAVNRRDFYISIFGTEAILFLDLWGGHMELVPHVGQSQRWPDLVEDEIYPHLAPALNLVDSILNPACNRSPGYLGLAAMQLIEAACQSAAQGQNVFIAPPREGTT